MTECIPGSFAFQDLGTRDVLADFNGGRITSDAGALLLRELDAKLSLLDVFAACFTCGAPNSGRIRCRILTV